MFAATSLGDAAVHSLIERDKRSPSVFRPPKFVRSSLPSRRRLTATAEPWYPTPDLAADVAAASMPAKPASAPPMPPMALGGVSPLKARPRSSRPPALNDVELGSPSSTSSIPFSPLSTTVSTVFHKFSDDATRERRYPVEMFLSVRKDASHTPHGILQWCVRQYVEVPALKVPPHLQLSMNEVVRAEDGITRGALGCDLRIKSRSKPVRQTHHKVMSVLSRITPQKYKELLEELLQLPLRQADDAELKEIVRVFFDKAVEEHNFSELYSQLVKELCTMTAGEQELDVELQDRLFCNRMKRQLLATCEDQFGIPVELTEDQKVDRTTGIPLDEEEVSHKRQRIKNRLVGNVKFVGELYKKNLVTDQIIETVVQRLVGNFDPQRPQAREEYVFEVFAMLIKTVAEKFKTVKPGLLARFITIAKMVETSHPKKRVQFLMMDLADLNRKHRWVPESRVTKQLDDTPTSTKTSCLSQVPSCSYSRESMSEMASTGGSPRPGRRPTFGTAAYSRDGGSSNFLIKEHTNSVHGNINGNGSHAPHACAAAPPVQRYQPRGPAMPAPMPLPPAANTLQSVSPTFSRRSLTSTHNSSFAADEGSASLVPTSSSNDGSTVDMREVTRQLVETFNLPHEELNVLQHLSEMPMKYRVMSLTRWLRYVSTHTKLFPERSRISKLFALLLAQHVLEPAQLQTVLLEWLRFDVKNSEYDVCPRMFENIAHMVMDAYGEESATVEKIEDVRELLHGGLFNFMLHELTIDRGTDQMATLIKAVHPITSQVVQLLRDPVSELDALRTAVEHRFRLLPYLLSVSGITESEMPGGPTPGSSTMASRLGTPLLRSSALGDSLTSTGHYDPLTQCLSFPKLASDVELSLYRRISADPATEKQPNAWVDEALRLMAAEGSSTKLAGAITLMKIVGAMLACSSVCVHKKHLLSAQDVDMALSRILAARPSPLLQSAAVMELVMHHTQALTECECGNGRMEKLREVFDRWTKAKLVEKTTVLNHLQRLNEATAYVTYHNFIAEVPWSKLLQGMLC